MCHLFTCEPFLQCSIYSHCFLLSLSFFLISHTLHFSLHYFSCTSFYGTSSSCVISVLVFSSPYFCSYFACPILPMSSVSPSASPPRPSIRPITLVYSSILHSHCLLIGIICNKTLITFSLKPNKM